MISVAVATFNHSRYIRKTLDSILSQKTDIDFEVVVHDDCSTDGTIDILKEYAEKYPDVIRLLLEEENQYSKGHYRIFTDYCFPHCKGDYIALCEGDDYWVDELKLQKQYDFLSAHKEYSFVTNPALKVSEEGNSLEEYVGVDKGVDRDITIETDPDTFLSTASMFLRKDKLYPLPSWYYDCDECGDFIMQMTLLLHGKGYILPDVTTHYRYLAKDSCTSRFEEYDSLKKARYYEDKAKVFEAINKDTEDKYRKVFAPFVSVYLRRSIICHKGMKERLDLARYALRNTFRKGDLGFVQKVEFMFCSMFPNIYLKVADRRRSPHK